MLGDGIAFAEHVLVRHDLTLATQQLDERGVFGHRVLDALSRDELVQDTRRRLELNVSEELALEALAYRLERALSG